MDKLITVARLIREQNQKLDFIQKTIGYGMAEAEEAFDATIKVCEEYNQKIKDVLNEPVKVSKKQFMKDQALNALNVN